MSQDPYGGKIEASEPLADAIDRAAQEIAEAADRPLASNRISVQTFRTIRDRLTDEIAEKQAQIESLVSAQKRTDFYIAECQRAKYDLITQQQATLAAIRVYEDRELNR